VVKIETTIKFEKGKILKRVGDANYRSLGQAGASVRKIAQYSIRTQPARKKKTKRRRKRKIKYSLPGKPPFTRGQKRLRKSIIYSVNRQKEHVRIGPSHDIIGEVGALHEVGGIFYGRHYTPRPYMAPALKQAIPRLPKLWRAAFRG